MSSDAIHSTEEVHIYRNVQTHVNEEVERVRKEKYIARLVDNDEWVKYKEKVELIMKSLLEMQGMIQPTDTAEMVGFRFMAISTAVNVVRAILTIPDRINEVEE